MEKNFLRKLEKFVELEIRTDAFDEIDERFEDISSKTKEGVVRTNEDIMKEVKQGTKDAGLYSKLEIRQAYRDYERSTIMSRADEITGEAIESIEDETNWRKVQKKSRKKIEEQKEWDKYTHKSLYHEKIGDAVSGYTSKGRIRCKIRATKTNVSNKIVSQSKDEVLRALGSKSELFDALEGQGLLTVNEETGKVDLTKLYLPSKIGVIILLMKSSP